MAYRVEISAPARADAENAYLWIANEAPENAVSWFQGLRKAIATLKDFPERCSIAPESRVFLIEIRQLLYGKRRNQYRILFGISPDPDTAEQVVYIYRIRHTSQRYLEGLEILGDIEKEK